MNQHTVIDYVTNLKTCINQCVKCPLHNQIDRPPMAFAGRGTIPIMLVTDSPGIEEYHNNEPFYSRAGNYLAECLNKVGFNDIGSFIRTSAIKCHQMNFEGNTPVETLACGDWLDYEIQLFQPKVIVAFGNIGVYRFSENYDKKIYDAKKDGTPKDLKGIMDKQGLIEWSSKYNCWIMYMLSPGYIERNKGKEQSYLDALSQLKLLYDNNYQPVNQVNTEYFAIYPKNGDYKQFHEEAKNFLNWIGMQPEYAVDIETTGLDYFNDVITLVSYSWAEGKACSILWDDALWPDFKKSLETNTAKAMHNGKFDSHFFHEINIFPNNFDFDTMVAAHQVDENSPLGLGFLTTRYLGLDGDYKSKFWGNQTDHQIDLSTEEGILKACEYANKDTDYTLRLKHVLIKKLIELGLYPDPNNPNPNKKYLFKDISMPVLHVLLEIEKNGLSLNLEYQNLVEEKLRRDAEHTYKEAENLLYNHLYQDQNDQLNKMIKWFDFIYEDSLSKLKQYNGLDLKQNFYQMVQDYQDNIQNFSKAIKTLQNKKLVGDEFKEALKNTLHYLMHIEKAPDTTLDDILLDGFDDTENKPKPKKAKNIKSGAIFDFANMKSSIKRKKVDVTPLEGVLNDFYNLFENLDNLSGIKMNLGSPDQMAKILYEILGLTVHKWTEKQKPSTDKETIELLAKEHPFPKLITEYRHIMHDISNYIVAAREALKVDNRIHPDFSQTRAVTGRFACSKPALHGISRSFTIRNMFIPAYGCLFVESDVSQAEVRMLAALSGDENLKAVFLSGEDIHTANARKIFKLDSNTKPTKEQRAQTKRIVFAIIYGSEVKSVAEDLQITVPEAQALFDAFYNAYPKAKEWMDDKYKEAQQTGAVTNFFGRKRRLPDIVSPNKWEKREAERQSVNAPVQSSSADYVSLAHIKLQQLIDTKYKNMGVKQVHQQHDMILVEAPIDLIIEVRKDVQECLEHAYEEIGVPIKADADIVNAWSGCPMTEDEVKQYKVHQQLGLLPKIGYCKYAKPIEDENGNVVGYNEPCNQMILPYSYTNNSCLDHHSDYKKLKAEGKQPI